MGPVGVSFAQETYTSRAQYDAAYYSKLGTKDGLSHVSVSSMVQDKKGFLWIGTQGGLNRFDGSSIQVFNKSRLIRGGINGDSITKLVLGKGADLWVGTLGGGVQKLDTETELVSHVTFPNDASSGAFHLVNDLLFDEQERLWIASDNGLAFLDEGETEAKIADGFPMQVHAIGLKSDGEGGLWALSNQDVYWFDRTNDAFVKVKIEGPSDIDLSPRMMAEKYKGSVSIINKDGQLISLKASQDKWQFEWMKETGTNYPLALVRDNLSNLWVSGVNGVRVYKSLEQDFITPITQDVDESRSTISALYSANDGTFWIGSRINGVRYVDLSDRPMNTLALPDKNSALSMIYTKGNKFLIGAYPGLYEFDSDTQVFKQFQSIAEKESTILSLKKLGDTVWFGSDLGIGVVHQSKGLLEYRLKHQFVYPHVIGRKKNGDILVGDDTKLLTLRRDGKKILREVSMNRTLASLEINDNEILVGGFFGLQVYDRNCDCFNNLMSDDSGGSKPIVTGITRASENRYWLATHNQGLMRVTLSQASDTKIVKSETWGVLAGLAATAVGGVLQKSEGVVWLSTTAGLSRFDIHTQKFTNFGERQGAFVKGYYVGSFAHNGMGSLYFGGPGAITNLPEINQDKHVSREPVITDVLLENIPIRLRSEQLNQATNNTKPIKAAPYLKQLTLPYNSPALSLDFAALNFGHLAGDEYRFRLDPLDKNWTKTGVDRRTATYTSLEPGDYVFRVAAADFDGVYRGKETQLNISIARPWWMEPVVAIIGAAIIFLLLWLLLQLRLRAIKIHNVELEQTVQRRTQALETANDDLRNALEQVKTLSGIVPICASCKKIRNDQGYWQQVEVYVKEHTHAEFSHGICTDCIDEIYETELGHPRPES